VDEVGHEPAGDRGAGQHEERGDEVHRQEEHVGVPPIYSHDSGRSLQNPGNKCYHEDLGIIFSINTTRYLHTYTNILITET
jgi:hypothetical protein